MRVAASKEEYDVISYFLWSERYITHVCENNTRKTEEVESVLSGLTRVCVCEYISVSEEDNLFSLEVIITWHFLKRRHVVPDSVWGSG
jgi:hypothetical protein